MTNQFETMHTLPSVSDGRLVEYWRGKGGEWSGILGLMGAQGMAASPVSYRHYLPVVVLSTL